MDSGPFPPLSTVCGRTHPISSRRVAAGDQQIRETRQHRDALCVLRQTPVPHLAVAKVPFHIQGRMLHLRPHRRLALLYRRLRTIPVQFAPPPGFITVRRGGCQRMRRTGSTGAPGKPRAAAGLPQKPRQGSTKWFDALEYSLDHQSPAWTAQSTPSVHAVKSAARTSCLTRDVPQQFSFWRSNLHVILREAKRSRRISCNGHAMRSCDCTQDD